MHNLAIIIRFTAWWQETHWTFEKQPEGRVSSPWGSDITQLAIVPFISQADADIFAVLW